MTYTDPYEGLTPELRLRGLRSELRRSEQRIARATVEVNRGFYASRREMRKHEQLRAIYLAKIEETKGEVGDGQ